MQKQEVSTLRQHISLVSEEKAKIVIGETNSAFNDLVTQRDCIESQIINIKSSNNKCNEEIEIYEDKVELFRKDCNNLETELKKALEELKVLTDRNDNRKDIKKSTEPAKKKEFPKADMRAFPTSSFSFNFGMSKNTSKERVVSNRSLNLGDRSSRSSNVSNNASMILDSHIFFYIFIQINSYFSSRYVVGALNI